MNNFAFVALLSALVYIAFIKTTFEIESGMFMYQRPVKVYRIVSDMSIIQRFHPFIASTKFLNSETSPEGILTEYHYIEDRIPIFWNYSLPITFDVKMEFTEPNKILNFYYSVWYGMVKGHVIWKVEERKGERGPGSYLSYHVRIACPWLTASFTEEKARETQDALLFRMRNVMERLES